MNDPHDIRNLDFLSSDHGSFSIITLDEVRRAVFHSRNLAAPDPDKTPNIVLKKCFFTLGPIWTAVFNGCLTLGVHPDCWKDSQVVPVPKPSPYKNELKNLRPISLINTMSKCLEKVMCARVAYLIEENELANDNQFGFRRPRSTKEALLNLSGSIDV